MSYIYVAGPLFNTHERWYLERIAEALEQAGHRTFLPHSDAGLLDLRTPSAQSRVFRDDIVTVRPILIHERRPSCTRHGRPYGTTQRLPNCATW